MPRSAIGDTDESVRYMDGTDTVTVYHEGSRGWRTHNPGLIGQGLFAYQQGAIGEDHGTAIFPDTATGRAALRALLADPSFAGYTVEQAIRQFVPGYTVPPPAPGTAPPPGSPPGTPPPRICPDIGLPAERPMRETSAEARERMAGVIERRIGYTPGFITTESLGKPPPLEPVGQDRPYNILFNGRTAVHAGSGGLYAGPDICNTPNGDGCAPVLYTNTARSVHAARTAASVKVNGHPLCHAKSIFSESTGDEGGSCGGVSSGTTRGRATFLTHSPDIFLEGEPAVRQFDLMVSNHMNALPMPLMQPGGAPPALESLLDPALREPGEALAGYPWEGLAGARALWKTRIADTGERAAPDADGPPPPPGKRLPDGGALLNIHEATSGETPDPHWRGTLPAHGEGSRAYHWLRLTDLKHGTLHLPLGWVRAQAAEALRAWREQPPGHGENILAHILPLCYTDPGRDPAKAAPPREGGFIYLFRDGHLWREIAVRREGLLRDVNLAEYAGLDERPATGASDQVLALPARVAGQASTFELGYAPVQWSWARINALGGMAENDPRRAANPQAVPLPTAHERAEAAQRRARRLQRLDLEGCARQCPERPAAGRTAAMAPLSRAPDLPALEDLREEPIAAVYLDDPLGVAAGFAERWRAIAEEHRRLVARITGRLPRKRAEKARDEAERRLPFQTALLAYHAFYNAANLDTPGAHGARHRTDGEKALAEAAGRLDHALIYDHYLAGAARRELRQRLRRLREDYVDWLDRHATAEAPAVNLFAALRDFATLPAPDYIRLWAAANGLLQPLLRDPTVGDRAIDLPRDAGPDTDTPAARRYLAYVLAPDSPWRMLFPDAGQVDVHAPQAGDPPHPSEAGEPPDPDGRFRPEAFAVSLAPRGQSHRGDTVRGIFGLAKSIVADLIKGLGKAAARMKAAERGVSFEGLVRLAFATRARDLRGMRLAAPGTPLDGWVIVSGEARLIHRLSRAERRARYRAPPASPEPPQVLCIVDEVHGGTVVGSLAMKDLADNDGGDPRPEAAQLRRPWVAADSAGLARTRAELIVAPADSPYALDYAHPELPAAPGVTAVTGGLRAAGKALPPIVAALEWVNLWQAWRQFQRSHTEEARLKGVASAATALLSAAYATTDAAEKVIPDASQPQFLKRIADAAFERGGVKILALDAFGAGAVLLNAGMDFWNAVDYAQRDEAGPAVAEALAGAADLSLSGVLAVKATEVGGQALAEVLGMEALIGPLGWALMAVSILAAVAAYALRDTPLARWAGHGPFAKDPGERRSDEFAGKSWGELYAALAGLLLRPRVHLRSDPSGGYYSGPRHAPRRRDDVAVDVIAPAWRPGQGVLDIQATRQRLMTEWEALRYANLARGAAFSAADRAAMARLDPGQRPVLPYLCTWLYEPAQQHVIGLTYHYRAPVEVEHDYRWFARARHITPAQIVIPPLPGPGQPQPDPVLIDPDIKGWAYATPLREIYR